MGKGVREFSIRSIVKEAGGREMLKNLGVKRAYDHFWKTFNYMATKAFEVGYSEIIEPDPTEVMDFLDNLIS